MAKKILHECDAMKKFEYDKIEIINHSWHEDNLPAWWTLDNRDYDNIEDYSDECREACYYEIEYCPWCGMYLNNVFVQEDIDDIVGEMADMSDSMIDLNRKFSELRRKLK